MQVVVPLAGRGSRFARHGIQTPKPLIQVGDRPMLAWALAGLPPVSSRQMIFVALREHEEQYGIAGIIRRWAGSDCRVVLLDEVTEGQLCSVLAAAPWLKQEEDLLVASADTLVLSSLEEDIRRRRGKVAGLISVAALEGEQWSFARVDRRGRVVEVAEKTRISPWASTGLYYFSRCADFLEVARQMIRRGEKTRGEYYVIPVYQHYLRRGWRVEISPARQVWDMGNPHALAEFLKICPRLAEVLKDTDAQEAQA